MEEKKQNKKRVAKYLRVSSREQAIYGYGIDSQNSKINDYLQLYDYNLHNIYEYKDDGISAKNKNRPSLLRLMKDIENGLIDEVVVYKLDRLTRSVIDMYELIDFLNKYQCNLIAIMDNIDIHTANGRMMVGVLAIIAQWERETIAERTADGLIEMCEEGKYPIGHTPFGWNKKDNILTINKEEAEYIQYLSRLARDGYILKEIEYESFHSKYSYNFNSMKIKKILMRKENYGLLVYKNREYYNIIPPILTKEESMETIAMLSKRFKAEKSDQYYFDNLVRCVCGSVLVQKSTKKKKKKYYYYFCEHHNKRINQDIILKDTLFQIFENCHSKGNEKIGKIIKERIRRLDKKIESNYHQFLSEIISEKIYTQTALMLNKNREKELAKLKVSLPNVKSLWGSWNDEERGCFIKMNVSRIIVDIDLKIVVKLEFKK